MSTALVRFNMVLPGQDPKINADRHRAAVDMAAFCEEQGFSVVSMEEHHVAANGWSPSALVMAGAVFGRTSRIMVNISAVLVPLHDPIRLAEDIATVDLLSGGNRLSIVAGLGYREIEYRAHRKEWTRRGRLLDEALDTLLAAWTGEPFAYNGDTITVTPVPVTRPHPIVMVGGAAKVSATRAAKRGLPFCPPSNLPDLAAFYDSECERYGTAGFVFMPPENVAMVHVAEDPDAWWDLVGEHFLHEATTYGSWQTSAQKSGVHSHATTVEELRAEGIYQVLTPQECIDRAQADPAATFVHHPLCGGTPIDLGWQSLQLWADAVAPHI